MRLPPLSSLTGASWASWSDEPIWSTGLLKPRLSCPFVVLPEDSPDNTWHLFAHTWAGVEHYTSSSGFGWKRSGLVASRGHFPSVAKGRGVWYLCYEVHERDFQGRRRIDPKRTNSAIMVVSTEDMRKWSKPVNVLDAADVPYAADFSAPRLSHPQIVPWQGRWRLYFGAGEVVMRDTGQKVSAYLSRAESDSPDSPFTALPEPLMRPDREGKWSNLGLGACRFVVCSDGVAAFQTTFYFDEEKESSSGSIIMLTSPDGDHFSFSREIMPLPGEGWASRCFTSCSVSFKEDEDTWYCWYSANAKARGFMPVREKLGLLLGAAGRRIDD